MQVLISVAAVAVAAAGGVVAITLATRDTPANLHPQQGKPPIPATLATPASAAIHKAFADWPHGSIPAMLKLQLEYPKDPIVQYYVGLAYAWAGYDGAAVTPLELAKKYGRDTPIEVAADTLLHPQYPPGDPTFQLEGSADALLRRGAQLEYSGHRESAEKLYAEDARRHPDDPEALAAAAFGLFDKSTPSLAFSKLGPVAKRFPRSQVVHFNLGYLLVYIADETEAVSQFRQTVALGPTTTFGKDAQKFLTAIEKAGTSGADK